jgi:hypothetical protein
MIVQVQRRSRPRAAIGGCIRRGAAAAPDQPFVQRTEFRGANGGSADEAVIAVKIPSARRLSGSPEHPKQDCETFSNIS